MAANAKLEDLKKETVDAQHHQPGLTTDHGVPVADTDNWLKASNGTRVGPSLLEDQVAREKIHRFDHERIPERVVHARGTGAFGEFKVFDDGASKWTHAKVLTDPSRTTPVFVRFSTVQGPRGSAVGFSLAIKYHLDLLLYRIPFVMFEGLPSNSTPRRVIGI